MLERRDFRWRLMNDLPVVAVSTAHAKQLLPYSFYSTAHKGEDDRQHWRTTARSPSSPVPWHTSSPPYRLSADHYTYGPHVIKKVPTTTKMVTRALTPGFQRRSKPLRLPTEETEAVEVFRPFLLEDRGSWTTTNVPQCTLRALCRATRKMRL